MSDALPLPPHPNVEQYKKLAKDFQRACRSVDPAAIPAWATAWAETLASLRGDPHTPATQREIRRDIQRVERQWHAMPTPADRKARCALADAQFFVARCHGFASWPKFVHHLEALESLNSVESKFERAVDAIVSGDLKTLSELLRANPALVRERSTREHNSTLLHYVSANGVEDFRQKTPANIVDITRRLLDAGADVNAESEAYGGRSTTLGLTATSVHPHLAGVQLALMEQLIERGAGIDRPDGGSAVLDCLHNGRGEAAAFLAERGARLNLEGAAGVGRLDMVEACFQSDGALRPPATATQMRDGFTWACEFGRVAVVDFLLQQGVAVDARLPHHGQTGLHWAAFGGHAGTVALLLEHGAPVGILDESFGGTSLEWAIYGWGGQPAAGLSDYYETVALLARAGATLDSKWFDRDDEERRRAVRKVRSDPRMQEALNAGIPRSD